MELNFSDFEKQNVKFDIIELQKAYKEILKIKDFMQKQRHDPIARGGRKKRTPVFLFRKPRNRTGEWALAMRQHLVSTRGLLEPLFHLETKPTTAGCDT